MITQLPDIDVATLEARYHSGHLLTHAEAAKAAGVSKRAIYKAAHRESAPLPHIEVRIASLPGRPALLYDIADLTRERQARIASKQGPVAIVGEGIQAYLSSKRAYAKWVAQNLVRLSGKCQVKVIL